MTSTFGGPGRVVRTRSSCPVVLLASLLPYKDVMKILLTPGFLAKVAICLLVAGAVIGALLI